jgi:hypothetical protein
VANLSKLTGLQELCLADPFWGECPVAGLCNYQTFMLYCMPHLSSLDTLLLADETKAAAGATFTKKQLYYNMRIRTMRRAAAGLARQAKAGCQVGEKTLPVDMWEGEGGCSSVCHEHEMPQLCASVPTARTLSSCVLFAGPWQQVDVAAV